MSNNDVFPARHMEHSVAIPALFQAVKSYLHFSQLSAWLNQTRGSAPKSVEYRYFTLPCPSNTGTLRCKLTHTCACTLLIIMILYCVSICPNHQQHFITCA